MKDSFLLLIICCLIYGCKIKVEYPAVFNDAKELFETKQYEKVINLLENTKIKQSQKTDWYYYYYGVSLYETSKRYTIKAIKNIKIAIAFSRDNPNYYLYLGQMYFDIAEYEKAKISFEKACALYSKIDSPDIKNVSLWIALAWCKIKGYDMADLKDEYPKCESDIYKDFFAQLLLNHISEDYINKVIFEKRLSIDEKLLIIDTLLKKNPDKSLCEKILSDLLDRNDNCESIIKDYFYSKLLFYNLDNIEYCRMILQDFCIKMADDVFLLNCNNFYVLQIFNKYLCFYYLLQMENKYSVNALQSYKIYRYKKLKHTHLDSDDIQLVYKEFKDDDEFLILQSKLTDK
ncbi:MAG: hypothetical protein IJ191_07540 [Treponema sp.]|nr:hypothetical protein [Treponema sp.]